MPTRSSALRPHRRPPQLDAEGSRRRKPLELDAIGGAVLARLVGMESTPRRRRDSSPRSRRRAREPDRRVPHKPTSPARTAGLVSDGALRVWSRDRAEPGGQAPTTQRQRQLGQQASSLPVALTGPARQPFRGGCLYQRLAAITVQLRECFDVHVSSSPRQSQGGFEMQGIGVACDAFSFRRATRVRVRRVALSAGVADERNYCGATPLAARIKRDERTARNTRHVNQC